MTREDFIRKYGDCGVVFDCFGSNTFYFIGEDDGELLGVMLTLEQEDFFHYQIQAGHVYTVREMSFTFGHCGPDTFNEHF